MKKALWWVVSLALAGLAMHSTLAAAAAPQDTPLLPKVNWNIAMYYNPRVNIDGRDEVTFHDNETASQWCRSVPGKRYEAGVSQINAANPREGTRYRWVNRRWTAVQGGDYPRVYICVESEDLLRTMGL